VQKLSIASKRVRRTIFRRLSIAHKDSCFVFHNTQDSEIYFCYRSKGAAALSNSQTNGCNEAAVYNYEEDTWSFRDLPGVTCMTTASLPFIAAWSADLELTWFQAKSAWLTFEGDSTEVPVCGVVGSLADQSRLLLLDQGLDGFLTNSPATEYLSEQFFEFALKDFDDLGVSIGDHKTIRAIYPQIRASNPDDYVLIQMGTAEFPNQAVIYQDAGVFYPFRSKKYDTKASSPYLCIRWTVPAGMWMEMSAFELDLLILSRR
jgi:hypothetical protein